MFLVGVDGEGNNMRKSFIYIMLAIIAVTVLVFLVAPSTPKATEELLETEIVVSTEQDTEEALASETNTNESMTDESSETDAEKSSEELKYIGRQIEGYVEPTNDWWTTTGKSDEEFNEYYKAYIALKDAFESNIVFDKKGFGFELEDYEWFKCLPKDGGWNFNDYLWICYAILTYYDGNVPCDYYVTPDDVYNRVYLPDSTDIYHICDAQLHGERSLHIRMDKFNYKIRVEEGVKRKNPNCTYGCCAD